MYGSAQDGEPVERTCALAAARSCPRSAGRSAGDAASAESAGQRCSKLHSSALEWCRVQRSNCPLTHSSCTEVPSEHTSGQADPPHPPLPAFQQSTHLLSDACTRLSVLFSSPPPPTSVDCAAVTSKVEQTATHLLACLYHFSPAYGTPQMMWTQHLQGEGGRGRDGWREGGGTCTYTL